MGSLERFWENWGESNPYFAVVSQEKYFTRNLTPDALADFFKTGEADIDHVWSVVRATLDPNFAPTTGVDFGCGVGRLVIPMARRCQRVIGLDVSQTMLEHGRKNAADSGIANAAFKHSDDALSELAEPFDFVHSLIVFQHIPVDKGLALADRLLQKLSPGGVAALHFTFKDTSPPGIRKVLKWVRTNWPAINPVLDILTGKGRNGFFVQMNEYDLNELLALFSKHGCSHFHGEFLPCGSMLGAMFFLRKGDAAQAG